MNTLLSSSLRNELKRSIVSYQLTEHLSTIILDNCKQNPLLPIFAISPDLKRIICSLLSKEDSIEDLILSPNKSNNDFNTSNTWLFSCTTTSQEIELGVVLINEVLLEIHYFNGELILYDSHDERPDHFETKPITFDNIYAKNYFDTIIIDFPKNTQTYNKLQIDITSNQYFIGENYVMQ